MSMEKMIRTGNDPVLKTVCEPFDFLTDDIRLFETIATVCRKVRNPTAAGLAAPQIGVSKRVIVTNVAGRKGNVQVRVMVNPVIVVRSEQSTVAQEQCLSYPGRSKAIRRASEITVDGTDSAGRPRTDTFRDFEARVIQHEVDHLDGVCRVGDDSPSESMPSHRGAFAAMVGLALMSGGVR